jgi:hypothetical protein
MSNPFNTSRPLAYTSVRGPCQMCTRYNHYGCAARSEANVVHCLSCGKLRAAIYCDQHHEFLATMDINTRDCCFHCIVRKGELLEAFALAVEEDRK